MIAKKKNGSKIIPFIVNAKSAAKLDTIEIKEDCVMEYTKKGWVTQSLLVKYLNYILTFGNALLIWDHCSAHGASKSGNTMSEFLDNKKPNAYMFQKAQLGIVK
eukprot:NODE_37_length_35953_cov_1.028037.p19 type:complete len:104 gc:universal NODE_37_length_35953_cov_1.028037:14809-15120(+)